MSKRVSLKARNASVQAAIVAAKGNDQTEGKGPLAAKGGPQDGKLIGLTIRLTTEQHEALRKIAFDRRVSIHSLFLEGVDFVLKKHG